MITVHSNIVASWLWAFRALGLCLLCIGSIVTLFGGAGLVVSFLPTRPTVPGVSALASLAFIAGGAVFAVVGLRAFRMRSRSDVDADIGATALDGARLVRRINR